MFAEYGGFLQSTIGFLLSTIGFLLSTIQWGLNNGLYRIKYGFCCVQWVSAEYGGFLLSTVGLLSSYLLVSSPAIALCPALIYLSLKLTV